MNHLYVWLRLPRGGALLAGEIRVADPDQRRGGYLRGEFRYDAAYLNHPAAFALDPLRLPLSQQIYSAERPHAGIHGIFEDSLPDAWGRGILIRRLALPRGQQSPPHLLALLGVNCLGALAYTKTQDEQLPLASAASHDLATLAAAAERYDEDPSEQSAEELNLLFRAASSPGGARPKVVIEEDEVQWIGKLRSTRDEVDMVRVEAACLALAGESGLNIPENRVVKFGERAVLLIRRFDISPEGGRMHIASMQTLAGVEGYYLFGYAEMADIVRQVSSIPEQDLPLLYRQAVFNAFLGNTDDHLKNFAMLRNSQGWQMTPTFDLVPDVPHRGEHILHFGACGHRPIKRGIDDLAKNFGLSSKKARSIISDVASAFANWESIFKRQNVSDRDIKRLSKDIEWRHALLA